MQSVCIGHLFLLYRYTGMGCECLICSCLAGEDTRRCSTPFPGCSERGVNMDVEGKA